jgi:hypothetical protein
MQHAQRQDFETGGFQHRQNISRVAGGYRVRFDD